MSPEREAFLKQFCLFVRLFLAALGLRCCEQAFSGCSSAAHGLLIAVASPALEHRLWVHQLRWLQGMGSVVVAHELSCSKTHGIFLDQGSNLCPLH